MANMLPTICVLKNSKKASNKFTISHEHGFQLVRVKVDDLRPFRYIVCKLLCSRAQITKQFHRRQLKIREENKPETVKNVYDCRRDAMGKGKWKVSENRRLQIILLTLKQVRN